jgi:hypothetical protein
MVWNTIEQTTRTDWRGHVPTNQGELHEIVVRAVQQSPADGRFLARDRYIAIVNGRQLPEDYAARDEAFEAGYLCAGGRAVARPAFTCDNGEIKRYRVTTQWS